MKLGRRTANITCEIKKKADDEQMNVSEVALKLKTLAPKTPTPLN